jgi:hypothetical protein
MFREPGVQQMNMPNDKEPTAGVPEGPPAKEDGVQSNDVVLMHGCTDDGDGIRVLRARDGRVEAGELRQLRQGKPLPSGDVVSLVRRPEHPLLWDVQVHYSADASRAHAGPANVASRAYRQNWDSIFQSKGQESSSDDEPMLN